MKISCEGGFLTRSSFQLPYQLLSVVGSLPGLLGSSECRYPEPGSFVRGDECDVCERVGEVREGGKKGEEWQNICGADLFTKATQFPIDVFPNV